MSLTRNDDLYVALTDSAANKFLRNLFPARPHYFSYATRGLGGTASKGPLEPLQLPGVDTPVDYTVTVTQPSLAFHPTGLLPTAGTPDKEEPISTSQPDAAGPWQDRDESSPPWRRRMDDSVRLKSRMRQ
jgi:hypothetical protein